MASGTAVVSGTSVIDRTIKRQQQEALIGCVIDHTYEVEKLIGEGCFGSIYVGRVVSGATVKRTTLPPEASPHQQVAIKVEWCTTPHPQLVYEMQVYADLWADADTT